MSCKQRILQHLQAGNSLTPLEAMCEYGTIRLGAYIHELRKEGHSIRTDIKRSFNNKTYAQYKLVSKEAI